MRLLRETLALAGLVFQATVVWRAWNGPPAAFPIHYGFAGRPDAYGDHSGLAVLLGVTALLYALLTVASFFPQTFNYPVEVTGQNRARLQSITVAMLGWLKAELTCTFRAGPIGVELVDQSAAPAIRRDPGAQAGGVPVRRPVFRLTANAVTSPATAP